MDFSVILAMVQSLASVPYLGKAIVIILTLYAGVVGVSATIGAVATSVVALWQGFHKTAAALAVIPGLAFFGKIAEMLQVEADAIESFEKSKLLPLLNRLSALPLPQPPKPLS